MKQVTEDLRQERKFCIPVYNYDLIKQKILMNSFLFSSIFNQRKVNSVYFDTLDLKYYFQTIDGECKREKFRLRWYGDTFQGNILAPRFERKCKEGTLVIKDVYPLDEKFMFKKQCRSKHKLMKNFYKDIIKTYPHFKEHEDLIPMTLVSYDREYFLSKNGFFRITLDKNIKYLDLHQDSVLCKFTTDNLCVVEVKYKNEHDELAASLIKKMGLFFTKNSKYINSVQLLKLA